MENIFTAEFIFNILLHITILFCILSLIFILYISKITENLINNEMGHMVDNAFTNNSDINNAIVNYNNAINNMNNNILPQINNTDLQNSLSQINDYFSYDYYYDVYSKNESNREHINNIVFSNIKFTCSILIIITFVFGISLYMFGNLTGANIKHVIIENIITFIFVGIFEIAFFTKIILYYSPVMPSLFYSSIINKLKQKFN